MDREVEAGSGNMDNDVVSDSQHQIAVILPFKASTRGKSRIELPVQDRSKLAVAMMRDTVRAVLTAQSVSSVLLVVEDPRDIAGLLAEETDAISQGRIDVMIATTPGLNTAILAGKQHLEDIGWQGRVAALLADLPGLSAAEIDAAALKAKSHQLSVVADRQSVGSTMLIADEIPSLTPHFGPNSLRAHRDAGAKMLDIPEASGLRNDVDEIPGPLLADWGRGLGPHTTALVRSLSAVS